MRNLPAIDVAFRRHAKEEVSAEDDLPRFPDFDEHIWQVIDESTVTALDPKVDTSESEGTATTSFVLPAAKRLGDYFLLRELGRVNAARQTAQPPSAQDLADW